MIKYVILNLERSNDKIQCSLQIKYLSTNPLRALIFDQAIQRLYNFRLSQTCKHDLGDHSELNNQYRVWKEIYNRDVENLSANTNTAQDNWIRELNSALENLDQKLDQWLKNISFRAEIEKNFVSKIEKFLTVDNCRVVFVIQSEDNFISQLFWHNWELMKDPNYQKIPLVFAIKDQRKISQPAYVQLPNKSLEVLVISGNTRNLDPRQDTAAWQKFISICHYLELDLRLYPSTETRGSDLTHWLDPESQHKFDIIYLLGHGSNDNSEQRIWINEAESLTFKQFCDRVSRIKTLKLVILNYCNSLPLAKELIKSSDIPQVIAMRETIFDPFSPEFLSTFLLKLVRCNFLPLAVREAQEHLEIEYSNEWRSSASVVALLQNLNKTPWTWPNNKESRFKKNLFLYCSGFLSCLFIGIGFLPIISALSKNRLINLPGQINKIFPPSEAEVENLLEESTVTIKVYDPNTEKFSFFAGIIFAYDKKADKSHPQQDTTYYILTTAKLLENKENPQIVILTNQGRKDFRNYRSITEVSQHLAIMTFNSNKTYKIAQLSKDKAALEEKVYMAAQQSQGDSPSNLNLIDSKITALNPMEKNQTYNFFYNSFDSTIKPKAEGNSIINQYGCLIGIDLGISKLPNQNLGIGIPEDTLLEVKKLKNPQDTSISNIEESKFSFYTESCQYE
jgi:hypothetical protein